MDLARGIKRGGLRPLLDPSIYRKEEPHGFVSTDGNLFDLVLKRTQSNNSKFRTNVKLFYASAGLETCQTDVKILKLRRNELRR